MWAQPSKAKRWKGDGGLGGLSPEATGKVNHLVLRMEDERRPCTAARPHRVPSASTGGEQGPLAWDARMLSWSHAALWAVPGQQVSCSPGPRPQEVLWLLHYASVLPRPARRLS